MNNFGILTAITPNDSADIPATTSLYIGGAGNVKVIDENGTTVTLAVVAGAVLPIRVTRVFNTDTTATGIVGLY